MDLRGKTVYLSGPMTGLADFNRAAFDEAEAQLVAAGACVLAPVDEMDGWTHEDYMLASLRQLLDGYGSTIDDDNRPMASVDYVVTLPGWCKSRGAQTEVHVAHECGIGIIDLYDAMWDEGGDAA